MGPPGPAELPEDHRTRTPRGRPRGSSGECTYPLFPPSVHGETRTRDTARKQRPKTGMNGLLSLPDSGRTIISCPRLDCTGDSSPFTYFSRPLFIFLAPIGTLF